ncbi:glycosyltransferase family 2 protein [Tuwongella immobilis]|uniref:Glycosyltransferase 2-like domain-containing protein n=1 Tax=Tuwongella immobilis TaxID=692036 RepID=A0A6C2YWD2_9BACT|nr:glycosyltransferase family 2 protein [Tuwongella immobilis]VIP05677.1 Putative glycosyltransferase OS=Methylomicrobium album BG8 GN=Metal_0329 PE=4 SV=1: Glycos_transf_2 [Tuwongella immobilis]VTS08710.1 Putative glycosyltransferase OS=Methylomicrobium album BG8 GN=Metal_0329 PE=4 SV=1: Glycos_transf_2 [Tuwongella immobilis]
MPAPKMIPLETDAPGLAVGTLTPSDRLPLPAEQPEDWRPDWIRRLSESGPVDLSICIASWNCIDYLRKCLESLHDIPQGVRLETIVVDNASHDGAAEMVAKDFPEVLLVRNSENKGFAKASNQAAALATGRYVFFLNNDTELPAQTLRKLLDYAEAHPEVGMIGPKLLGGDGAVQISYRRRPSLLAMLHRTSILRWTGLFRGEYQRYRRDSFQAREARRVEILMGAAVLMRRDVFEQCGRWDEDYHFGGEDIDLSERVGRQYPLVYLADVEITHFGRISSRQNIEFAAPNVLIGYVHYFRKTGTSRLALAAYKATVTIDLPFQLLGKSLQLLWRTLRGQSVRAAKTRIALRGLWHFARHELTRFWKA